MSEKPYYGSERTPPKVFEFEENLKRFFEDYRMVDELPIITGKLHPTVYQEILDLETRLWEQNQHELGAFKYHLNVGENLGQASIGYEEARPRIFTILRIWNLQHILRTHRVSIFSRKLDRHKLQTGYDWISS